MQTTRLEQAISYTDLTRKDFGALTISQEHTLEERFLAALGMTAKKI
jgi:hypothetical protein